MYPKYVVWLQNDAGNVAAYELFFSGRKAKKSYKRALTKDRHGLHELFGETDSYTATSDVKVKIRYFGDYISTKKDMFRKSFLNLDYEEERELAEKYQLPPKIIRHISELEKAICEKKQYYMHPHDAHTCALIRKYTPSWLSQLLHKI